MQRGDDALAVLARHLGLDNDGHPVIVGELARLDAIHGEAAGQTRHTAKDDSNALAWWCEIKYSYTWIMVTQLCVLLAMRVSPHAP